MTLSWLHFVPALVLLLFPKDRMIPARARLRTYEDLQGHTRPRAFWLWAHPLSLVRGFAGTWLLLQALTPDADVALWGSRALGAAALLTGILAVAVIVQTRTSRDIDYALAPVFFLGGVLLALLPWLVSVTALILAIASMMAFRNWMVFFVVGTFAIGGAGVLWEAPHLLVAAAGAVMFLPALLAFGSGRILAVPSRQ